MHKNIFKDNKLQYFMVSYNCQLCNFSTSNKYNYQQHLKTKKHQTIKSKGHPKNVQIKSKNEQNEQKNEQNEQNQTKSITNLNPKKFNTGTLYECPLCCKQFTRNFNLQRHISVCKISVAPQNLQNPKKLPKNVENILGSNNSLNVLKCNQCGLVCSRKSNLVRHQNRCKKTNQIAHHDQLESMKKSLQQEQQLFQQQLENKLLQEQLKHKQELLDQKDETIKIAKQGKQIIHNTTNKTINYLNNQYGGMIAMEQFLYNLEHTEQLTQEERQKLLMSYKDSGIELFARSFSHIMKENCRRQLLKEGLPEMDIIPLYCSDGNLRSHKEKGHQGWSTHYDDHSLNKMINISSDQVYESYQKSLMIFGKERNKVFKQIKQDNHSQNEDLKKITDK